MIRKIRLKYIKLLVIFSCILPVHQIKSQNTLSLNGAEGLLQKNNLLLLAEEYSISAAEASVIQSKIWELPLFTGEINAINPSEKKIFDVNSKGQKAFAIQQLIYVGGKKKNEIAFAKNNVEIAKSQFEQLVRTLKYELNITFYTLFYDLEKLKTIDNQISKIEYILNIYQIQEKKGNIPLKDIVRLQSLALNFKNERNQILHLIFENQYKLKLLIGDENDYKLILEENEIFNTSKKFSISKDTLIKYGIKNNIDYQTQLKIATSQELYLKWQKSLSIPDLNIGASYDQRGGAFQNQVNLTFGIPIVLWNKNKGNIKISEAKLKQQNLNNDYSKSELINFIEMNWKEWKNHQEQINNINEKTTNEIEEVYQGVLNNFEKRNISLLEFSDFMESYTTNKNQLNEITKNWIISNVKLNYITNTEILKK